MRGTLHYPRPSDIQNIPQAIWWAIITITTVGYGDLVPISFPGKIIGAFALVFGVLLLSLPVAIIGNKFQEIYLSNQKEETQSNREKTKV
jgi:voltage-gated potassium channel Kch